MTCFLTLGWKFPEHIFDLHTAYLAASNVLLPYNPDEVRKRQENGLADACRAYGIEGWENIDKTAIAKAIGEGRWREYGRDGVLELLRRGRRKSTELLWRTIAGLVTIPTGQSLERILHWSNYSAKTVAQSSGARHADRHAAVESGAGEQGRGHRAN